MHLSLRDLEAGCVRGQESGISAVVVGCWGTFVS